MTLISRCVLILPTLLMLQLTSAEHLQNFKSDLVISCDSQQDSSCEEKTLDQLADDLAERSPVLEDVSVYINTSHLELTTNASFSGLRSLTISGSIDSNTTVTCSLGDYGGLEFKNITNLTLASLTITNCGFPSQSSKEQDVYSYFAAVAILCCKDMKLSSLNISNNDGIGLKILNHQGGTVHIELSIFLGNRLLNESRVNDTDYRGGGGVYIGEYERPPESITFRFENCTFQDNVAHTQYFDYLYTDDLGWPIVGYGMGGGVAISFHEDLRDIHVTFSWCKFKRNLAFKGGGLAAGIKANKDVDLEASNVTVAVENSLFENNGCNFSAGSNMTASGGGVSINFASNKSTFHSNKFIIHHVIFVNNCALFGGGLYFYSERKLAIKEGSPNTVEIENCTFESNQAHTGSAVDITPNVFQRLALIKGTLTIPVFKNCTFVNNSVKLNNGAEKVHNQKTYGIGTLYISLYNVKFEGDNEFKSNIGTAIHIVNGNIDMSQSSAYFFNNSGIQGGAIALIGQSSMIVGPNRSYNFINNTAYVKGGGLYVQLDDNHDITASKSCFIGYHDCDGRTTPVSNWTATIKFNGNRARAEIGHAIFATSLYPCQSINKGSLGKPTFMSINSSEVFSKRKIEIIDECVPQSCQIATEGARLKPKNFSLRVIPGERFSHEVNIIDDLHKEVSVTLIASIMNYSHTTIRIDKAFSSCVGEQLVLKGKPKDSTILRLQTTTSRQSYTSLNITLRECPPGFVHSENECICDCDKYDGLAKCNTTYFTTFIIPGYWAGKVSDENDKSKRELITSYCPLNFCKYKQGESASGSEIQLPQDYDDWNEAICGESRKGTICGSCAPGYTTHFHSPNFECKNVIDARVPCKLGWFIYILSELVPVTVVFITLLVFNITFTSGAINGFILFSQILLSLNIDASGFIKPTSAVKSFLTAHQFIYGLFNLDFFYAERFSFCLWPNASALDMLAFKYVTIVYVLFLMIPVILFINKCHRGKRYLAKFCRFTTLKASIIHGISAFFILCYSQCLNVSLKLLRSYRLTTREGSNLTVYNRVWLNGNIVYFSGKHLPYVLPALLCLLTIGLFPLIFLLVCPLFYKVLSWFGYGESKLVNFISQKLPYNRLKPLLDSFQSCFSDNYRFFAGVYFLYRWLPLFLINAVTSRYHVFYTAVEAGIIIILALHALCQPYAKKVHNIIDTLLFADLALINAITLAHYYIFRTALSRQQAVEYVNKTMALQLVLIYLPLLVMLGYALLLVYRFISGKKYPSKRVGSLLYKMSSESSTNAISDDLSDLPHRLVTGNTDYKSFEDTEGITCDEIDLDVTY